MLRDFDYQGIPIKVFIDRAEITQEPPSAVILARPQEADDLLNSFRNWVRVAVMERFMAEGRSYNDYPVIYKLQ